MAETIKSKLTDNQIKFMGYWEKVVLKNKNKISSGMLDQSAEYLNYRRSGNCSTCMKNDSIELNNKYRGLLNLYNQYLIDLKEIQKEIETTKQELKEDVEEVKTTIKKVRKKK